MDIGTRRGTNEADEVSNMFYAWPNDGIGQKGFSNHEKTIQKRSQSRIEPNEFYETRPHHGE
jgi:hypothetical protein